MGGRGESDSSGVDARFIWKGRYEHVSEGACELIIPVERSFM